MMAKTKKRFGAGLILPLVIGLATTAQAGPTATPTATPSATPTPFCLTEGVSCQINSDCCSNECSGTGGNKVCQPGPTSTPTATPTSTPTGLPMAPPPPTGEPPLATAPPLAPLPMTPPIQGRITATSGGQSAGPFAAAVAGDCSQPGGINTDTEMLFAVTSSGEGTRDVFCDLTFRCEDANNPGFFFFGCEITLTLAPVANSGFHDHDSPPRPTGTLIPDIDVTPSMGDPKIVSQYTATEVSGKVTLTASAQLLCCPAVLFPNISFDLITRSPFASLWPLSQPTPSEHYTLVGTTSAIGQRHLTNHWGSPLLLDKIKKFARAYGKEFPGNKLEINDMSLPWGGVFDLGPTAVCDAEDPPDPAVMGLEWGPCHDWHRFGKDVDINNRLIPIANRARAKVLAERIAGLEFVHAGSHWHFKVE